MVQSFVTEDWVEKMVILACIRNCKIWSSAQADSELFRALTSVIVRRQFDQRIDFFHITIYHNLLRLVFFRGSSYETMRTYIWHNWIYIHLSSVRQHNYTVHFTLLQYTVVIVICIAIAATAESKVQEEASRPSFRRVHSGNVCPLLKHLQFASTFTQQIKAHYKYYSL